MDIRFDSETGTVQVDGARLSLEVLRELANPDTLRYYRFVRVGETVFINSWAAMPQEASEYERDPVGRMPALSLHRE